MCGSTTRASDDHLAAVNPVLLVEVTSPPTEEYDRGEKLRQYQRLPALQEVLLVSHRLPQLTVCRRDQDGWREEVYASGGAFTLSCLAATIAVDDVYRDALEDL